MNFIFISITRSFRKRLFPTRFSLLFLKVNLKSWSIVFFGSDNYSLTSLKELHKNVKTKIVGDLEVVTVNTSNPVYKFASSMGLKTHLWPPVLNGSYDFGVTVSFGKFIPKKIIDLFPLGIINVHASLLPRWRGGMPIVYALKNGDAITGVSIIKINSHKFDTGDVIERKSLLIGENELMPSLHMKLSKLGSECLMKVINGMPGSLNNSMPQSNEKVSYALKIKKEASEIKWNEMTAVEIYNLYRALFGLFELKTTWQGIPVKLLCLPLNCLQNNSETDITQESLSPGNVYYDVESQHLIVKCKEKSIRICTLKLKGKLYSALNFNRGFLSQISKNLRKFGS